MLLEGPQQTTGSIGQTWKTGNGRSRLVLTGQHKHTPPPPPPTPREPRGGDGTTRGTPHPPTPGGEPGTEHEPASTMQTTTNPPPTPGTNKRNGRGAGGPQPPTTPQSNTRTTHPTTRLGGHSGEATPGPIPNPEAKTPSANGTAPARTRKSRTPPSTHHPPPPTQNDGRGKTNNNTTTPDQETCHRLTGRLIQKQIPPQPKDHIHVPGQARQSVALPQCTFSW